MSNGLVFLNGSISYAMMLFKKHPSIAHRTIIDYNLAITMLPPMLIGSLVGSVLAGIVPSTFQLALLILVVSLSLFKTFFKARALWKQENLDMKNSKVASKATTMKGSPVTSPQTGEANKKKGEENYRQLEEPESSQRSNMIKVEETSASKHNDEEMPPNTGGNH